MDAAARTSAARPATVNPGQSRSIPRQATHTPPFSSASASQASPSRPRASGVIPNRGKIQ